MAKTNIRWLLLVLAIVLILGMRTTAPKLAVADIEGRACSTDDDCPCWSEGGRGIGIGDCEDRKCDMTYCLDVQPVGEWLENNPWQWVRNNVAISLLISGLLVVALFWPKDKKM